MSENTWDIVLRKSQCPHRVEGVDSDWWIFACAIPIHYRRVECNKSNCLIKRVD